MKACKNCKWFDSGDINQNYCHRISNTGELDEALKEGAAAYDNFWVRDDFYCKLHEPVTSDEITVEDCESEIPEGFKTFDHWSQSELRIMKGEKALMINGEAYFHENQTTDEFFDDPYGCDYMGLDWHDQF